MSDYDISEVMDDIFNVTQGENIKTRETEDSQEDSFSSNDSSVSFDEKADFINSSIGKISSYVEFEDIPEAEKEKTLSSPDHENNLNNGASNESEKSNLETILSESVPIEKNKKSTVLKVAAEQISGDNIVEFDRHIEDSSELRAVSVSDTQPEKEKIEPQDIVEDEDGWFLTCYSDKFLSFYKTKREILPKILNGGRIPFDKYKKELSQIKIDCRYIDMNDHDRIGKSMSEIRQWRDRVIEMRCSMMYQYHHFKRFVPMLEGELARCFYDKPAIRQGGVRLEHMHDIELYFSSLEALYELSQDIVKNLDTKFESISRLITMSMPTKSLTSRFIGESNEENPPFANDRKTNSNLSAFDKLDNSVEDDIINAGKSKDIVSKEKTKGELSWEDID